MFQAVAADNFLIKADSGCKAHFQAPERSSNHSAHEEREANANEGHDLMQNQKCACRKRSIITDLRPSTCWSSERQASSTYKPLARPWSQDNASKADLSALHHYHDALQYVDGVGYSRVC